MPTKRQVLDHLKRAELIDAVEHYDLYVEDRRVSLLLLDAVARSKKARLTDILAGLPRKRLQEICRALALDDHGREKALYVDRLTGRHAPVQQPLFEEPAPKPKAKPPRPTNPSRASGVGRQKREVASAAGTHCPEVPFIDGQNALGSEPFGSSR